jgi:hypothetical protein
MENELARLKAAFEEWRTKKRYAREAVPAGLLKRARAAAQRHGPAAVHRATKVDRSRLKTGGRMKRAGTTAPAARVPAFSRVELAAPVAMPRPFAEVEMPTGLTVRLFTQTEAALELLSSLCSTGGAR